MEQHQADQHAEARNAAGPKRIFRAHRRCLAQDEFTKPRLRRLRHGLHMRQQGDAESIKARQHNRDGGVFANASAARQRLHREHAQHTRDQRPRQQGRQRARIAAKCSDNHRSQHHTGQSGMANRIGHQRAPAQQRESADRAASKPKQGTTRQHHQRVIAKDHCKPPSATACSSTFSRPP